MPYSNDAKVELTGLSKLLEQRLIPITAELNSHPLRINRETWLWNLKQAEIRVTDLTELCRGLANDLYFRPNSSKDCARALGSAKTDKDTLIELANRGDSLPGVILEARSAISRLSQLKKWRGYAEQGFVQCTWNSNGQPHGRYTSENPCLCNRIVPIRETIEADPDCSFLSTDLAQAEYVTWSSLSGDRELSRLFLSGLDFHEEMARTIQAAIPVWNLHGQEPRQAGKTLNFAILYQMQPFTLSRKLGCPLEIADAIIRAYYRRARRATDYIQKVLDQAKKDGYVETYFGRRRYCPELQTATGGNLHEVEKRVWHHRNAGTAAEYLKRKQVFCWEALRKAGLKPEDVRLVLQVYDELIWQVKDNLMEEVRQIIEPIMKQRDPGFLPFQVETKITKAWEERTDEITTGTGIG